MVRSISPAGNDGLRGDLIFVLHALFSFSYILCQPHSCLITQEIIRILIVVYLGYVHRFDQVLSSIVFTMSISFLCVL